MAGMATAEADRTTETPISTLPGFESEAFSRTVGVGGRAREVHFRVLGIPQPKGSTKAFYNRKIGRVFVTSTNANLKPWEACVRAAASEAWGKPPTADAVLVGIDFTFVRPRSVTVKKRPYLTVKPDLDKLIRGLLDGLTGVVFVDDAQVIGVWAAKHCGDTPSADVTIQVIE